MVGICLNPGDNGMVQVKRIIVVATALTTLALSGCKAHVKPTHGRMASPDRGASRLVCAAYVRRASVMSGVQGFRPFPGPEFLNTLRRIERTRPVIVSPGTQNCPLTWDKAAFNTLTGLE
jgi:hypothetical protein